MTYETTSAEREGFEPPEVLPSTVFKTAAIDRSAISPIRKTLPRRTGFSRSIKSKTNYFFLFLSIRPSCLK